MLFLTGMMKLTFAIRHVLNRILVFQFLNHSTDEAFRPFGGRVDGDEFVGSFRCHLWVFGFSEREAVVVLVVVLNGGLRTIMGEPSMGYRIVESNRGSNAVEERFD